VRLKTDVEDPGSIHTLDRCVYRNGYCDMQPWARAAHLQCIAQVNSAFHPFGIAESITNFGWDKGENVTSAAWQVTLCDPIWHVSSRSGEAGLHCPCEPLYIVYFTYFTHFI